jgi:NAD(P)H-hydrate epimerase
VTILPFPAITEHSLSAISINTIIVDAMLGTGMGGKVRGDYARAVAMINALDYPVLAADMPSGLCSDTGKIMGCAVMAEMTVTFIGRKLGLLLAEGPAMCGKVVFNSLAMPEDIYRNITPATLT